MKIDRFFQAPNSTRLIDADVGDDDEYAALVERNGGGKEVVGKGWAVKVAPEVRFPMVRLLTPSQFLVVDARSPSGEANAHVVSKSGVHVRSFRAGDAVEDVVCCARHIVVSYFDEGVHGGDPISKEGVVVFSESGQVDFGYRSQFGKAAVEIDDCYALCPGKADSVWFLPYLNFPLVHLWMSPPRQHVVDIPRALHGAAGISVDSNAIYFHSPNDGAGTVLALDLSSSEVEVVGKWPDSLRGVVGGRFVGVAGGDAVVVTPRAGAA